MTHPETFNDETAIPSTDASADTQTLLAVESTASGMNAVTGAIADADDEDWIAVELNEDTRYTINVAGHGEMGLHDPVLKLFGADGALLAMNDDLDGESGRLDSELQFTPPLNSGAQVYYISVSAHGDHPGLDQVGGYRVVVTETLSSSDTGPDIIGTELADKLGGTVAGEKIMGLGGNDVLVGAHGADELDGGEGNDLLAGGPGADVLRGGPGIDVLFYALSQAGVNVNLADKTASGGEAEGDTLADDVESVVGSGYDDMLTGDAQVNAFWGQGGADYLRGGDGADLLNGDDGADLLKGDDGDDVLNGGAGADRLEGGPGDDVLGGGPGADTLIGNDGRDAVTYQGSPAGVTIRLHDLTARGGDAEGDVFGNLVQVEYTASARDDDAGVTRVLVTDFDDNGAGPPADTGATPDAGARVLVEMVPDIQDLVGSAHADVLAGDSRDNIIFGGDGDDALYGGHGGGHDQLLGEAGNDVLYGGPGADNLRGGAGDDLLYADTDDTVLDGGDGVDTLSFANMGAAVVFDLSAASAATGIENLVGTAHADVLAGDAGDNVLEGLAGADVLVGGGGGADTVSYEHSDRGVRVDLGAGSVGGGHAEGDSIDGFRHATGSAYDDNLAGSAEANRLWGLAGDDHLDGLAGDDQLVGGPGDDWLHGGDGQDALTGADGDDDLHGGDGADLLAGGPGNDTLYDGGGDDNVAGGPGDDILHNGGGNDTLSGGPGNDVFVFTPADDAGHVVITDFESYDGSTGVSIYNYDDLDLDNIMSNERDAIYLAGFNLSADEMYDVGDWVTDWDADPVYSYYMIDLTAYGGGTIEIHNEPSLMA